jgi:hypothetical protein
LVNASKGFFLMVLRSKQGGGSTMEVEASKETSSNKQGKQLEEFKEEF